MEYILKNSTKGKRENTIDCPFKGRCICRTWTRQTLYIILQFTTKWPWSPSKSKPDVYICTADVRCCANQLYRQYYYYCLNLSKQSSAANSERLWEHCWFSDRHADTASCNRSCPWGAECNHNDKSRYSLFQPFPILFHCFSSPFLFFSTKLGGQRVQPAFPAPCSLGPGVTY